MISGPLSGSSTSYKSDDGVGYTYISTHVIERKSVVALYVPSFLL